MVRSSRSLSRQKLPFCHFKLRHSDASPDKNTFKRWWSKWHVMTNEGLPPRPLTFHISPSHALMPLKCADGGLPAAGKKTPPPLQMFLQMSHAATSCSPERDASPGVPLAPQPSVNRQRRACTAPQMNQVKGGGWMSKEPRQPGLVTLPSSCLYPVYVGGGGYGGVGDALALLTCCRWDHSAGS